LREPAAIDRSVRWRDVAPNKFLTNDKARRPPTDSEELKHALILSRQIDYLGKMPTVTPKPVRTSEKAKEMLRFDLENENETIRNYRESVRQCEALGEFAMAEQIRQILVDEQDHQIDLATALGEEVPNVSTATR